MTTTPVPDTTVFSEMTISLAEMPKLLETHEVWVDSPDGFVEVTQFVDKGEWEEYVLETFDGTVVRCNESHLFETVAGWKFAGDLVGNTCVVIADTGPVIAHVRKTGKVIPIVDIQVQHKNQRYYTNGISSHNTAVGKSLFMCHVASGAILEGKNVLYVTLEMAEERIAERIDANLLDVSLDDLSQMPKAMFESAFASLRSRHNLGKLIIKEYPTSSAHVGHFRSLLTELALKKAFLPDLIIIDYINICASQRLKNNGQTNSYTYVKAIAEELRGLAVEFNVPFLSATQFNREGFDSSDPSITNTSESFGLPQTVDLQVALVTSEELERDGLLLVKQLKNRYTDVAKNRRFTVKVDKSKMRVSNDPRQDFLSDPIASSPKQTREMPKPGLPSTKPKNFLAGVRPDIKF